MCRLLLSKTTISIKFGNHEQETVYTNVESPQWDGISGTFYNIECEDALSPLREQMNEFEPNIEHSKKSSQPKEMEYADDSDFQFESEEKTNKLKSIVKDKLSKRNVGKQR